MLFAIRYLSRFVACNTCCDRLLKRVSHREKRVSFTKWKQKPFMQLLSSATSEQQDHAITNRHANRHRFQLIAMRFLAICRSEHAFWGMPDKSVARLIFIKFAMAKAKGQELKARESFWAQPKNLNGPETKKRWLFLGHKPIRSWIGSEVIYIF